MDTPLRTFWANTPRAVKIIGMPFFAVFSVMVLVTCGDLIMQTYFDAYTRLGEGFSTLLAAAIVATAIILLIGMVNLSLLGFVSCTLSEYYKGNKRIKRNARVFGLIFALSFVVNLSSEYGIFWKGFNKIHPSLGGGFVELCTALTGAIYINLIASLGVAIILFVCGHLIAEIPKLFRSL